MSYGLQISAARGSHIYIIGIGTCIATMLYTGTKKKYRPYSWWQTLWHGRAGRLNTIANHAVARINMPISETHVLECMLFVFALLL